MNSGPYQQLTGRMDPPVMPAAVYGYMECHFNVPLLQMQS